MQSRPALLGAILAGGAVGTIGRYLLESVFPAAAGQWPWATFTINVAGAFLLGVLLFALARRGADTGSRRLLRLMLGTGVLGAFTTYSTFAVEVHALFGGGHLGTGMGYALASVATGVVAAAGVALLARRLVPARRAEPEA